MHIDSLRIIKKMSDQQVATFLRTILEYQETGKIPELDFGLQMAIDPFIRQFENDNEKWRKIAERNAANGSKGGRPKTQNNPVGFLGTQENPEEPRKAVTGTVTDTGTGTVTDFIPLTPLVMENPKLDRLAEGAFQTWQMIAEEQEVQFTQDEWNAIKGFTKTKPSLQPNQIRANIIQLNKWAQLGLDIENSLLKGAGMEPRFAKIEQPFMAKLTDAKGNPIYGQAIAEHRNRIIEQEKGEIK